MTHTFVHRGVNFTVMPDQETGFFVFTYCVQGIEFRGRTECRHSALAVRKAEMAIDRAIRAQGADAAPVVGRRSQIK